MLCLDYVLATTDALREECFRLRYQIYCVETAFEPANDSGLESDRYDGHAVHALLKFEDTFIGHVRMVLRPPFPCQEVCNDSILNIDGMAEGSRICVSRERIKQSGAPVRDMLLTLVKAMVHISRREGVTHWCGLMEPRFLRRLQVLGIHFIPLGDMVMHHGSLRQPGYNELDVLLARALQERPGLWA